jgi:hypothetical protein
VNFEFVITGENGHVVTSVKFFHLLMQSQEILDHPLIPQKMRCSPDALKWVQTVEKSRNDGTFAHGPFFRRNFFSCDFFFLATMPHVTTVISNFYTTASAHLADQ